MMWGMFKKSVIADRLAAVSDPILNNPHAYHPTAILLSTIFFSFQIYCDFSGYSDIAIGAARVMGFTLMRNFDRPYNARNIPEFWRRWHISLSTWFRDYVFIPTGGSRRNRVSTFLNLLFVFMLSGLWHGANWTFIIWGALHGLYMIIALGTNSSREKIRSVTGIKRVPWLDNSLQRLVTFSLVTTAWVFFRSKSVGSALYILTKFKKLPGDLNSIEKLKAVIPNLHISSGRFLTCLGVICLMEFVQSLQQKQDIRALLYRQPRYVRWAVYYCIVLFIIYMGCFQNREFIYFQF